MDKNRQIKFAKSKHLKQLKRNARNKHLRLERMRVKAELRKIRKFNLDV